LKKKPQTFLGTNTWPHTCTINCTRWQTRILLWVTWITIFHLTKALILKELN
jgi:hypothetical protein